jgi:hypothetical protein
MIIGAESAGSDTGRPRQVAAGSAASEKAAGIDTPPVITSGPFLGAGAWPLLPTSADHAFVLKKSHTIVWTFSDDQVSCSGRCLLQAEYQQFGSGRWTRLPVDSGPDPGLARVCLPVEILEKDTTYGFRFSVTDCAGQATQSAVYYFAVPPPDNPPVIGDGPFLSSGPWPVLALSQAKALVIKHNVNVLWNFSDDYVTCSRPCTHRARYRRVGEEQWVWLDNIATDATAKKYAYVELPVAQLRNGSYMFRFDVQDCARQRTESQTYYFNVEKPQM